MKPTIKTLGPLVVLTLLAGPAFGQGQGTNDVIDFIHGNATNERDSGNGVTPSLAPGPWACGGGGCTNDTQAGGSIGEFITSPLGLDIDTANADFANADDRGLEDGDGPNFSEPYDHGGVGQDTGEP